MRKYVEGRNPQTVSRGKFTRATALVASAHPKPTQKKGVRVEKLNVGGFFPTKQWGYGAAVWFPECMIITTTIFRATARQTAAYRLGYVSVRRLQTKVSEYGGTGKDFKVKKRTISMNKWMKKGMEMKETPKYWMHCSGMVGRVERTMHVGEQSGRDTYTVYIYIYEKCIKWNERWKVHWRSVWSRENKLTTRKVDVDK